MPDSTPFTEHYGDLREALPGQDLPWLTDLRQGALARFTSSGLPTPRQESWKYTSLRPLEKVGFGAAGAPRACVSIDRAPSLLPAASEHHRLVFVDGQHRADLSTPGGLPQGAQLTTLRELLAREPEWVERHLGKLAGDEQPLLALNTAMMMNGFVLRLAEGTVLHEPVEVVHLGGAGDRPLAYHPRNLIVLAPRSQATLIEHHTHMGEQPYYTNSGTEVALAEGAVLHHYKLQAEALDAFHTATVHAEVGRNALYDAFGMTTGARLQHDEVARVVGQRPVAGPAQVHDLDRVVQHRARREAQHEAVHHHRGVERQQRLLIAGQLAEMALDPLGLARQQL
ncbi:MAG TPA: SufD family Fe-S cluster assembly protein, partial [Kiloniellaceae bacterium]|nr:SufD family Fe-S cluster assembly protein [Kiloniellaceae bacterium]